MRYGLNKQDRSVRENDTFYLIRRLDIEKILYPIGTTAKFNFNTQFKWVRLS
jgi:hypothetical protein